MILREDGTAKEIGPPHALLDQLLRQSDNQVPVEPLKTERDFMRGGVFYASDGWTPSRCS